MNFPSLRGETIIIGLADAMVFYLFYVKEIDEWILLACLAVSFYLLTRMTKYEDRITLRQAKNLTMSEAVIAQNRNELPPGKIEIFDAGTQEYAFNNEFRPWKYLIGVVVWGDQPNYYLSTVSLNGAHLRLSPKPAGWNFDDEFKIVEVKTPAIEAGALPPNSRNQVRIA